MKGLTWENHYCVTCSGPRAHDRRTQRCRNCDTPYDKFRVPAAYLCGTPDDQVEQALEESLALWDQTPPSNGHVCSDEAAAKLRASKVEEDCRTILAALYRYGPATRDELAKRTGIDPNSLRPRVLSLMEARRVCCRREDDQSEHYPERGDGVRLVCGVSRKGNAAAKLYLTDAYLAHHIDAEMREDTPEQEAA